MANYATLKAAIAAAIKTNGNKEITGQLLQDTLDSIVSVIGANYTFAGVATPSTNPGTPDQNVFYLASQAGTYTNFNATVLPAGISILMWGGSWSSQTFFTVETTPTSGSANLITSGAVFDAIKNDGGAYDVSAHFPTGGEGGGNTYTLETAVVMVPSAMRKGGMSIKFVQSSDNNSTKYVQYRYMSTSTANADFTNTNNWQGVDSKPKAGSKNLVESDGVADYVGLPTTLFEVSKAVARNGNNIGGPIILKAGHRYKATVTRSEKKNNVLYICSGTTAADAGTKYMDLTLSSSAALSKEVVYINDTNADIVANIVVGGNYSSGYWVDLHLTVEESINNVIWTKEQVLTDEQKAQVWNNIGIVVDNVPTQGSSNFVRSGGVTDFIGYPLVCFQKEWENTSVGNKGSFVMKAGHVYTAIATRTGRTDPSSIKICSGTYDEPGTIYMNLNMAEDVTNVTKSYKPTADVTGNIIVEGSYETATIPILDIVVYEANNNLLWGNREQELSSEEKEQIYKNLGLDEMQEDIGQNTEDIEELTLYHKGIPVEPTARNYRYINDDNEIYQRSNSYEMLYYLGEPNKTYKITGYHTSDDMIWSNRDKIGLTKVFPADGESVNIIAEYIPKTTPHNTYIKTTEEDGLYIVIVHAKKTSVAIEMVADSKAASDYISLFPSTIYGLKFKDDGFNLLNRVYIEGLINSDKSLGLSLNGMQSVYAEENDPATVGDKRKTISVTGEGYYPSDINLNIQRVNSEALKNKNLRIMHVGDSLTDRGTSCCTDFILKCLNQDYGNISGVFVGTKNDTVAIKMGNYEFTCKTSNEGTAGWSINDYLRKVTHCSTTGTTSATTLTGKTLWDSLGLATKTRNGTQGRSERIDWADYEDTEARDAEVRAACHGWYDADPSAELWDWIVNKRGITSFSYGGQSYTFGASYSSADDAAQIAAIKYICSDDYTGSPKNKFFDYATVQSSNGQYAFSLGAYLGHYKTLANDGTTRLVVGSTAGDRVSDVTAWDLCTPSHICLIMAYNGGSIPGDELADELLEFATLCTTYDNTIKVIIGVQRHYGCLNPDAYAESGVYMPYEFSKKLFDCNESLKAKIGNTSHKMIELYATQTPTGSYENNAFDLLDGSPKVRANSDDNVHGDSVISYMDRAYQFVGCLITTL